MSGNNRHKEDNSFRGEVRDICDCAAFFESCEVVFTTHELVLTNGKLESI